jgi:hypothetical protein
VRVREVDDRLEQIRLKGLGGAQIGEAPRQPDESVLNEVLSQVAIAGQDIGKPQGMGAVSLVELGELGATSNS